MIAASKISFSPCSDQIYFQPQDFYRRSTNDNDSQPKLLARMAWSQGFYQSNGILRKKNMTGNNIFKKSP